MKKLFLLLGLMVSFAHAASKPNVVFFLVDDMGWRACGAYGSKYYETPNIDRFAKSAMRFTSAYAQPLCSPTRCSLLTGQSAARHGITGATGHKPPQPSGFENLSPSDKPMLIPVSKNYMEPSQYTLAESLRDSGYRTAHIGKWHIGLLKPHWPEQQGFDVAWHCHPDPGPPGAYFSPYGVVPDGKPTMTTRVGTITDGPPGEYIVDRLADEAIKFIEANKGRPFFLNLWNYGVHGPWGHKEEYTRIFAEKKPADGELGNPIMASMMRSVDECFGRVIEALEKNGLLENTIIIFNSDNGGNIHSNVPGTARTDRDEETKGDMIKDWRKWAGDLGPMSNLPLREGKGTLYEGGTRVPLMWSWAGKIAPGSSSDAIVGAIDLYPTLLELLQIERRESQIFDGISYASVLFQTKGINRKAYFNYHPGGNAPGKAGGASAIVGDWKLIRWFGFRQGDPNRYELYNLRDDVGETSNRAGDQLSIVKELDVLIDGFLADTGAQYPRPNPEFKAASDR